VIKSSRVTDLPGGAFPITRVKVKKNFSFDTNTKDKLLQMIEISTKKEASRVDWPLFYLFQPLCGGCKS
jgi:hypothetical protein